MPTKRRQPRTAKRADLLCPSEREFNLLRCHAWPPRDMATRRYSETKRHPPAGAPTRARQQGSNPIGRFRPSGDLIRGGDATARLRAAVGKTVEEANGDPRADEMRDVAAKGADFLD